MGEPPKTPKPIPELKPIGTLLGESFPQNALSNTEKTITERLKW